MKHVTFTKPMIPHNVGDRRLVPDAVAARLEAEGVDRAEPAGLPALERRRPRRGVRAGFA